MSEFPNCDAIKRDELPSDKQRRIAAALLHTSEEAHQAYHHDAQFQALITQLAYTLSTVVDDMATAAQVRIEGLEHATKAYEQKTWPMLFVPGEENR